MRCRTAPTAFRTALVSAAIAVLAAGCGDPTVTVTDAYGSRGGPSPLTRGNAEQQARAQEAIDRSRRAIEEQAAGTPPGTLVPPTGPRIVSGSRVEVRFEAIDEGHGVTAEPVTIGLFVPPPPGLGKLNTEWPCKPCWDLQYARGMNSSKTNHAVPLVPYVVSENLSTVLSTSQFLAMGVGGTYRLASNPGEIVGDHARARLPDYIETSDPKQRHKRIAYKMTVLSACKADVRRVQVEYFSWSSWGILPKPRGTAIDGWHEYHGCKL